MAIPRFIKFILFICISTGTIYFLIWISIKEILNLYELEFTSFWKLFPILFVFILGIITYITYKINELLYSYIYIIVFSIFGHTVNSFTCCSITLLIKLFLTLSYTIEFILAIIFPIILSVYGLINTQNTIVERVVFIILN